MDTASLRSPVVREALERGLALHRAGSLAAAAELYREALALAPDDPVALGLLGSLEVNLGRPAEAVPLLRRAAELAPGNASTLFNLGLQLRCLQQYDEAIAWLEKAVEARPDSVAFRRELAEAYDSQIAGSRTALGAWQSLLDAAQAALETAPQDNEALFSRGRALLCLRQPQLALNAFEELARVAPAHDEIAVQMGHCHRALTRFEQAHACYLRALERNPDDVVAHLNLGNVVLGLGRYEEAVGRYREVLRLSPDDPNGLTNLGAALVDCGRFAEALESFDRALVVRPGWPQAAMARAFCLLRMGDFERGWAAHELRLHAPVVPWVEREFGAPAWDGLAEVSGLSVLVWAEQGLGDGIQFARYASELARLGARVILEIHTPLTGLAGSLEGVARVVPFQGCDEPVDLHCALMSLPHLLGLRHGYRIPAVEGYLRPSPARLAHWADRMDGRPNVGIAWSGNPRHDNDHRRSMPLARLLAHLAPGVRWWCVQKDVRESDEPLLASAVELERPELGDFDDTAALVAHLDAVISVDTSVAHLAGALGRPTLLMLPDTAEWRWQTARTDSPWYSSMRLFRQGAPGDWDGALRAAMAHLGTMTGRAGATISVCEVVA